VGNDPPGDFDKLEAAGIMINNLWHDTHPTDRPASLRTAPRTNRHPLPGRAIMVILYK
jgi:hypothetical protein